MFRNDCYFLINDNNTHFVRIIFSSFTNQVLRGAEINFNIQTRNLFFQKSEFVDIIRTNPVLSCPMWNCDVIIIHFIPNNLKYMYLVWFQCLEDLGNVIEADRYIHAYVVLIIVDNTCDISLYILFSCTSHADVTLPCFDQQLTQTSLYSRYQWWILFFLKSR